MRGLLQALALTLLLVLAACDPQPAAETPDAPTQSPATVVPTTRPTGPADLSPTSSASDDEHLPSPIFDLAWEDRSLYEGGLIESERAAAQALPGATVYHIDVRLSEAMTQIEGREAFLYQNREDVSLEALYLRLFPNLAGGSSRVSNVLVDGNPVTPDLELAESVLRIPLPEALPPGAATVVVLDFAVEIPTLGGGNYGTFVFTSDVLALAHFYPMVAVYDDEGWNVEIAPDSGDVVYADSSYYVVRVQAPAEQVIAASGIAIERQESAGRQTVVYAAGPMRDFYLVASERYERKSTQIGATTINSYTFPEYGESSDLVLQYTADSLRSFNERAGVYPFTELDVASTPTDALGVEYPGIVVINQRLYDPGGEARANFLEGTVVHEAAHQWFYSIIGNDQLDEPWLDEALAQYATLLYFRDQYGEAGEAGFRSSLEGRWQRVEEAQIPVGLPVAAYSGSEYGAIVYGRGPLFFAELEQQIGEEAFDRFLLDYYDTFQWQIATGPDLQALAEESCNCNLDALFAAWIYP